MIYDFGDQVGRHSASASFSSSIVLPLGFPFCIRRLLPCQCVFSSPICAIRARSDGYSINFPRVRERPRGSSLATDEESSLTIRSFAVAWKLVDIGSTMVLNLWRVTSCFLWLLNEAASEGPSKTKRFQEVDSEFIEVKLEDTLLSCVLCRIDTLRRTFAFSFIELTCLQ